MSSISSQRDTRDYRDELQAFDGMAAFVRSDLRIGDPTFGAVTGLLAGAASAAS